jgi:hypothetical protein
LKHINNILLVSWHGNLYKKIVKENRIGYICNYKIKEDKKNRHDNYVANWKNIEGLIDRHYNDIEDYGIR